MNSALFCKGTVFIEKPDAAGQTSQTLLISGDGSLPVLLSNSIGIPNILTSLEMMNGAQARVADNLQVGFVNFFPEFFFSAFISLQLFFFYVQYYSFRFDNTHNKDMSF